MIKIWATLTGQRPRYSFSINLTKHDAITVIAASLDMSIWLNHAATATELNAALPPPAIALNKIAAVFFGTTDPIGCWRSLSQPITQMANDLGTLQRDQPCSFKKMNIHADEQRNTAQ